MRIQKIIPFSAITFLMACGPTVTFIEPQPANTKDLTHFPKKIQGIYSNFQNGYDIIISDQVVYHDYDFHNIIHKDDLDSTMILEGDSVRNVEIGYKFFAKKIDKDSLSIHVVYNDTIFEIGTYNKLRKFKGHYFLNSDEDFLGEWQVEMLSLTKGILTISRIRTTEEIDKLKEITNSPSDTLELRNFELTKKQFKEFMNSDGFNSGNNYIRLK